MKPLIAASCLGVLLAGPLAAQTPPADGGAPQPPVTAPPSTAPQPPSTLPEPDRAPATTREPNVPRRPGADRRLDDPPTGPSGANRPDDPLRRGSRMSETAPVSAAGASGEVRFSDDLRRCDGMEPASRTSCRQEMFAARAQGFYRN